MQPPDRHERWFPELTPPPGGLLRLRERIREDELRRARRFRLSAAFAAPVAAACALFVFLVLPRDVEAPAPRLDGVVAARLGLAPLPDGVEVVREDGTHLVGAPSSSSGGVDIVWIGAGSRSPSPPSLD